MKLKVLGSGSLGNCYLLHNDTECLILEVGIPFIEVKKALQFDIRKIIAVLVSHEHFDHAKYISQYMRAGIPVYSAFETQSALEISTGERTRAIPPLKKLKLGNFTITPFNVPHDTDIECYGYLIEHKDIGKLLFLTDLMYCPYNFLKQNINHIMIEANYSNDFINSEDANRNRVLQTHMELQTTLDFISTNDNPNLKTICLTHLSMVNSDQNLFLQKTKEVVRYGADVYIAHKGLEIQLNNDELPF